MRCEAVVGEPAQHDQFLARQHAGVEQLGQHALDAIGVFTHVLQKQHAALDLGPPGRAQQRGHHGQVAAPQHAVVGQHAVAALQRFQVGRRQAPAGAFTRAAGQVLETRQHDLVRPAGGRVAAMALPGVRGVGGAKALTQRRSGPGDRGVPRQQAELQRGEVAEAHPVGAALRRARNRAPGQVGQQAAQAIAAAADQRHVGAAGGRAADGRQTRGVVAGKALPAEQRRRVHFDVVAERLQPSNTAAEGRAVAHGAGRRIDVDMGHKWD